MALDVEDLLPGMTATNTVAVQYYANGAECEVTEFDEAYHDEDERNMPRWDTRLVFPSVCAVICEQLLQLVQWSRLNVQQHGVCVCVAGHTCQGCVMTHVASKLTVDFAFLATVQESRLTRTL